MFGSTILEVAIGLIFVYLVLSLICTTVNEYIAQALSLRAEVLYNGIHSMFEGQDAAVITEDIFDHPMVKSLGSRTSRLKEVNGEAIVVRSRPSYIPPSVFSTAVMDLLGLKEPPGSTAAIEASQFSDAVGAAGRYGPVINEVLSPLLHAANGNLDAARKNVEKWYDDAMQRVSGFYKRKIQVITFCVALSVSTIFNADSLMLIDRLWSNPTERTRIEASAKSINSSAPPANATSLDQTTKDAALGLMGWKPGTDKTDPRRLPDSSGAWVVKLIGLLITAFAAALGAPFWFDTLNKVMNIRAAGPSPNEKTTKSSTPAAERNRVHSSDSPSAPPPANS